MNTHTSILRRLVIGFGILFPFIMSVVVICIASFVGWEKVGWNGYDNNHFQLPLFNHICIYIVCLVFLYCLIITAAYLYERISVKHKWFISSVIVFILSFFIRISCLYMLYKGSATIIPFSDFEQVWLLAQGDLSNLPYKSLFATWMNFALVERFFIKTFGVRYLLFLGCNCFISSLSSPLIYGISKLAFDDYSNSERISLIAAIIYALYIPSALFACFSAPDVYIVPLYLFGVLLLLYSRKRMLANSNCKALLLVALSGAFLGLSSALKSFGIIVIIAYLICSALDDYSKIKVKRIGVVLCSIALLICSYSFAKNIVLKITERAYDVELDYSTSLPHYLLVGLNTEGEGQIHIGSQSRSYYQNILNTGISEEDARAATYDLLIDDWKNEENVLNTLVLPKLVWAWQDDSRPIYYAYWMNNDSNMEATLKDDIFDSEASLLQAAYLIIMATGAVGSIVILRKYSNNTEIMLTQLIITGFFFITLISEAQSRYKYVIIPLVCIMSSIGIYRLTELLSISWNSLKSRKLQDSSGG